MQRAGSFIQTLYAALYEDERKKNVDPGGTQQKKHIDKRKPKIMCSFAWHEELFWAQVFRGPAITYERHIWAAHKNA